VLTILQFRCLVFRTVAIFALFAVSGRDRHQFNICHS